VTAERRAQVAGIFLLIGAEAFIYGFSFPYFSLSLHHLGMSSGAVGLNSFAGTALLILARHIVARLRSDRLPSCSSWTCSRAAVIGDS
jgi:hypothetical protein